MYKIRLHNSTKNTRKKLINTEYGKTVFMKSNIINKGKKEKSNVLQNTMRLINHKINYSNHIY